MPLIGRPTPYEWTESHFIYLQTGGPFYRTAPVVWSKFTKAIIKTDLKDQILGFISLSKGNPRPIYRAGVILPHKPKRTPKGLKYTLIKRGHYLRFKHQGAYREIPASFDKICSLMTKKKGKIRADFCIERMVNDQKITPEQKLLTEIYIPYEIPA